MKFVEGFLALVFLSAYFDVVLGGRVKYIVQARTGVLHSRCWNSWFSRVYATGWYLYGHDYGCCSNYRVCFVLASAFCFWHDVHCTCCQCLTCGPGCRKDPFKFK